MDQWIYSQMLAHPLVVVAVVAVAFILFGLAVFHGAREAERTWFLERDEDVIHVRDPRGAA